MLSDVHVGQELTDPAWDSFAKATRGGTYQRTSMWVEDKSPGGWRPIRIALSLSSTLLLGFGDSVNFKMGGWLGWPPPG
jgi:hypothetical protein